MHWNLIYLNFIISGEGGGMFDHFLVEARMKLVWRSARMMEGVRNVLKVSELNK